MRAFIGDIAHEVVGIGWIENSIAITDEHVNHVATNPSSRFYDHLIFAVTDCAFTFGDYDRPVRRRKIHLCLPFDFHVIDPLACHSETFVPAFRAKNRRLRRFALAGTPVDCHVFKQGDQSQLKR